MKGLKFVGARKYLRCAECNRTVTSCQSEGGTTAIGPIARVTFVRTGPSKDDPGAGDYRYEMPPWVCFKFTATGIRRAVVR
jgi:hypothetical protein